ncbi:NADH-quinone oxidoreductase subunit J [Candidatus Finniella inopinata]|uniref:NADH-quinone oxidoreductase subunit J n=1 Tax=Candidatus Finniella inopinata TaxID=1696036 RepID=A0A4Q7DIR3_9PROT|nr:NADH-quinone oxidoreductase subunit J [Candidatus Finniella inopinata]RZI46109.1 NADH-quinone oxidoreductase subunit J [Candidatus Finniella inopinata]
MDVLFYLFSAILIGCAAAVVCVRNTLYSVLFLIMAFFNAGALFLLMGAEFIALILVIVYVGAIAVLFLFAVMMLNASQTQNQELVRYHLGSIVAACVFAGELIAVALQWKQGARTVDRTSFPMPKYLSNTEALGELLYTHYFYVFQISGLILLVAMIGVIVLTLSTQNQRLLPKQNLKNQLNRTKKDTLVLKHVEFRQGLKQGNP